jgi:hypothetical protein
MGENQRPTHGPEGQAGAMRLALQAHEDNDQNADGQKCRKLFENTHQGLLQGEKHVLKSNQQ